MRTSYRADGRLRVPAAAAALAVQAALAYALISGLAASVVTVVVGQSLDVTSIAVLPTSPPPPPPEPPRASSAAAPERPAGAAGRRAEATQVIAPKPPIILIPPPPIVTAPTPGAGDQASAGAAGQGGGPGAGRSGVGPGGGGTGGLGNGGYGGGGSGARRIAGGLRDSDYPAAATRMQAEATVFIRFQVGTDGRVRGCTITRSSGSPLLDDTTCRLVEKRFRYRPARDAEGWPIESTETTNFTWGTRVR